MKTNAPQSSHWMRNRSIQLVTQAHEELGRCYKLLAFAVELGSESQADHLRRVVDECVRDRQAEIETALARGVTPATIALLIESDEDF